MVRAAEPQELDIHALLRLFVDKVEAGAPATYATFRGCWQEMKFSFIYEGCKERHLSQDYISWLLAAASDHFWAPLPERPCKAKPAEDADATAPGAPDITGSDTLAPRMPYAGGAVEAADRALAEVLEDGGVQRFRSGRMRCVPESSMPDTSFRCSDLPEQAAPLLLPTDKAASHSAPSPIAVNGHPQTVQLDESSLLALLMDNEDMDALEPDQYILAALEVPSGTGASTAAAQDSSDRPSFALKAGALYIIYTIHRTQPAYKGRPVRAYLPISSLQVISDMLPEARQRQIPDIPHIVKCLVQEQAFVIGGVRRPPAGHQIVRDGPVRMAQVDMSERNAMQPMTMRHLANTQLALRELKHVQLLCDSYSKAQRSVFAAADPEDLPPSIADLGMGERFRDLARQITLDVHGVLSGDAKHVSRRQRMADQKAAQAAAAAEAQGGNGRTVRNHSAKKPAGELQADLSDVDLGGLPSMAKAVERKKGLERAEILSKQQEWAERGARALAAAEDMPDDLGHPVRQGETMARCPEEVGMAAAGSMNITPSAAQAGAFGNGGQPAERYELAAAAARPAQARIRMEQGRCLLTDSGQPRQEVQGASKGPAGRKAAARVIASVFGDDSSSSTIPEPDHHDMPEHLDPPASLPGKCESPSRPSEAIKPEVQASKRHNTRGAGSRGKVNTHEASLVHKAKRKAAAAKQATEHAGSAGPKKTRAVASKPSKRTKADLTHAHCSKSSTGKALVIAAKMHSQRDTEPLAEPKRDQAGARAVDWKAYADALDAKMAEAEALLANDSE